MQIREHEPRRILKQLGVVLHPQKTRIVHVRYANRAARVGDALLLSHRAHVHGAVEVYGNLNAIKLFGTSAPRYSMPFTMTGAVA